MLSVSGDIHCRCEMRLQRSRQIADFVTAGRTIDERPVRWCYSSQVIERVGIYCDNAAMKPIDRASLFPQIDLSRHTFGPSGERLLDVDLTEQISRFNDTDFATMYSTILAARERAERIQSPPCLRGTWEKMGASLTAKHDQMG